MRKKERERRVYISYFIFYFWYKKIEKKYEWNGPIEKANIDMLTPSHFSWTHGSGLIFIFSTRDAPESVQLLY